MCKEDKREKKQLKKTQNPKLNTKKVDIKIHCIFFGGCETCIRHSSIEVFFGYPF